MTPLEDLLQQCTVKITVPITVPGGWGTGFFVAPGLILTCAHVVRKAADLQVTVFHPAWQPPLSAIVKTKADDGKTLDLALVKLSDPLPDHPCVLLDEGPVAIAPPQSTNFSTPPKSKSSSTSKTTTKPDPKTQPPNPHNPFTTLKTT